MPSNIVMVTMVMLLCYNTVMVTLVPCCHGNNVTMLSMVTTAVNGNVVIILSMVMLLLCCHGNIVTIRICTYQYIHVMTDIQHTCIPLGLKQIL